MEMKGRKKVTIVPVRNHKNRDLSRESGKNFEPSTIETAIPTKYIVDKHNFSISGKGD
jgi:hypothetical protein